MSEIEEGQEVEFEDMYKDIKDHVVYIPGLKVARTDEEVRDSFQFLLNERNELRQSYNNSDVGIEYFRYRDDELSSKIHALGWVLGLNSYLDAEFKP